MYRSVINWLRRRRYARAFDCTLYSTARILPQNQALKDSIRIGARTHIRGELLTFAHGGQITIGSYCYVGEQTHIWSAESVRIGDRVLISHNCNIFDNDTHPLDALKRHQQFKAIITTGHPTDIDLKEEPITINDDVLIGCNVVVLKGVTIGEGAVIGAGSVVTRDVPARMLAVGNPARVIREITEDDR